MRAACRSVPARPSSTPAAFSAGRVQQTGDPLSLAIDGPGFFQVQARRRHRGAHPRRRLPRSTRTALVTPDRRAAGPAGHVPKGDQPRRRLDLGRRHRHGEGHVVGRIRLVTSRPPRAPAGRRHALPAHRRERRTAAGRQDPTLQQGSSRRRTSTWRRAMMDMIDAQRSFQLDAHRRSRPRISSCRSRTRSALSAMPPIDTSQLPPDVRKAGPDGQQLYAAALAFEQQLAPAAHAAVARRSTLQRRRLGRLGRRGLRSSATHGRIYQQMLPDALSQGVTAAGGLGLAEELYRPASAAASGPSDRPRPVTGPHRPPRAPARLRAAAARDRDRPGATRSARRTSRACSPGSPTCSRRWDSACSSSASATSCSPGSPALRRPASDLTLETILVLVPAADAERARSSPPSCVDLLSEIARVHGAEPRPDPAGARVPRPPDARPLRHAAGRLLAGGRPPATPQPVT